MNNHKFHMVNNSPWPILTSMSMFTLALGSIKWMHKMELNTMLLGITLIMLTSFQWWRDITRESTFQGNHNKKIIKMMKWGMMLFILKEILFFFTSFFHMSISPSIEIGLNWPPMGIEPMKPMGSPLLNTIILISSGISITWAHHSIMIKMFNQTMKSMVITITLGTYFSMIQLYEYMECSFSISLSIWINIFFMTGFQGIHVIIGTIFLIMSTLRMKNLHYSMNHMVGFESSAWYWHFVDVVWLMLYISVYWWGM